LASQKVFCFALSALVLVGQGLLLLSMPC